MARAVVAFSVDLKVRGHGPRDLGLPAGASFTAVDSVAAFRTTMEAMSAEDVVVVDTDAVLVFPVIEVVDALRDAHKRLHVVVTSSKAPSDPVVCSVVTSVYGGFVPKLALDSLPQWWHKITEVIADPDPMQGTKLVLQAARDPLLELTEEIVEHKPSLMPVTGMIVDAALDGMLADLGTGRLNLFGQDPVTVASERVSRLLDAGTSFNTGPLGSPAPEPSGWTPAKDKPAPQGIVNVEDSGDDDDPGPAPLVWNSSFPEDRVVNANKVIMRGTTYLFRTALETAINLHAVATQPVRTPIADGEQIQFIVVATGLQLQLPGSSQEPDDYLASEMLTHHAGRGTDPFEFELTAQEAGTVVLELRVMVRNAAAARQSIELRCLDPDTPFELIRNAKRKRGNLAARPLGGESTSYPQAFVNVEARQSGRRVQIIVQGIGQSNPDRLEGESSLRDLLVQIFDQRSELKRITDNYVHGRVRDELAAASPNALLDFAKIGASLHEALFGYPDDDRSKTSERRKRAGEIALMGREPADGYHPRLNVVASDLPIPWALLYDDAFVSGRPSQLDNVTDVEIESFWGYRFRLDRSGPMSNDLDAMGRLGADEVTLRACINPHLDLQGLAVVDLQREALTSFSGSRHLRVLPTIESGAELEGWLKDADSPPGCDFLYFFCHAKPAIDLDRTGILRMVGGDAQATLGLDAANEADGITVKSLRHTRHRRLPNRPLVFMNACATAPAGRLPPMWTRPEPSRRSPVPLPPSVSQSTPAATP